MIAAYPNMGIIDMKKRIGTLILLVILSQLLLIPSFSTEAKADTRVMLTVSVGGAACGAYFFLRFVFRSSLTTEPYQYDSALFNHSAEGWQVGFPVLNLVQDEHNAGLSNQNTPEAYRMDILKIRF
jgi:hypothetical protein